EVYDTSQRAMSDLQLARRSRTSDLVARNIGVSEVNPSFSFFFTMTPTTGIYTLSLHDALPIYARLPGGHQEGWADAFHNLMRDVDRKSTRLNSSHLVISYAVSCLKKNILTRQCPVA